MRPYSLCFKLSSFNGLSSQRAARVVEHFVRGLIETNEGYLETHRAPLLYQAGIYYSRDNVDETELQWWDIPAILLVGYADCKALAAWRAAELRMRFGYNSQPITTIESDRTGREVIHVTVTSPRGIEDPSEILGM